MIWNEFESYGITLCRDLFNNSNLKFAKSHDICMGYTFCIISYMFQFLSRLKVLTEKIKINIIFFLFIYLVCFDNLF